MEDNSKIRRLPPSSSSSSSSRIAKATFSSSAAALLITAAIAFAWVSPFIGIGKQISLPPSSSASDSQHGPRDHAPHPVLIDSSYYTICNNTLYPRLCHRTVSSISSHSNLHHRHLRLRVANASIRRAAASVDDALARIKIILTNLNQLNGNSRQIAALKDCRYMLRRSLELLSDAELRLRRGRRRVRGLLSAAMTYQDSCLDGFADYPSVVAKKHLGRRLRPITRLLSNSLAVVRDLEREAAAAGGQFPALRRALVGRGRPLPNVVVSRKGPVRSIAEAVRLAPAWSRRRFVVWIKAGVYKENVIVPANKTNIVFVGDGWDRTVISGCKNVADGSTTFNSATVAVAGAGFLARDLAIINTSGPLKGQAVALRVDADCSAFYRCYISGYQDTLYVHSLSQFYRECTIRGTIDFIFGNAAAVFQSCRIEVLRPSFRQKNMVTAQGRDDPNQPTGTTLDNCTIVAAADEDGSGGGSDNGNTYLGRPWKRYARTMVMNSYLGEVVHPAGWHEWSEPRPLDKVELREYRNRGPGAGTDRRVKWARPNATREEAAGFAVGELIGGRWLNATAYPFYTGLLS